MIGDRRSPAELRLPEGWAGLVAVAAGGAAGGALRQLLVAAAPQHTAGHAWATLVVNVAGSFALGLLLARPGRRPLPTLLVAVGLLGSFTTFSSYTLVVAALAADGGIDGAGMVTAAGYLLGTVVLGVAAAAAGAATRRRGGGAPT